MPDCVVQDDEVPMLQTSWANLVLANQRFCFLPGQTDLAPDTRMDLTVQSMTQIHKKSAMKKRKGERRQYQCGYARCSHVLESGTDQWASLWSWTDLISGCSDGYLRTRGVLLFSLTHIVLWLVKRGFQGVFNTWVVNLMRLLANVITIANDPGQYSQFLFP